MVPPARHGREGVIELRRLAGGAAGCGVELAPGVPDDIGIVGRGAGRLGDDGIGAAGAEALREVHPRFDRQARRRGGRWRCPEFARSR